MPGRLPCLLCLVSAFAGYASPRLRPPAGRRAESTGWLPADPGAAALEPSGSGATMQRTRETTKDTGHRPSAQQAPRHGQPMQFT